MTDAGYVKSPCVNICSLDDNDVCTGCYRSASEIALWTRIGIAEQREVVARADRRYREAWGVAAD